ncbi:MAG TPA: 23S rRNA (uracil(1939)-C(5))-methyltransferase RlmD [Burkholderiaceae bacterium]|nr:23S rRNA (uracil(1939)-C(5))-methyltransferase RlmD [Burkholderiaceae bacterium]
MSAQRFEVEIESLDQEGRGVAHRDGKAVFIEGALPGERVVYERYRQKPRFETGRAVTIERESAMRVVPRCPHAGLHVGSCGGCSMQHIDARAQVALKQRVLEDALWHIGRVRPQMVLRPIEGPAWHYRHRARMAVRYVAKKGSVLVGFHERASSYVADIRQCEVLPKKVSDLLLPLRDLVYSLTLHERLPQIELAVGSVAEREAVMLVFRVLQPPTLEDRALLRAFGVAHAVDIWLQPAGPDSAVPLDNNQSPRLELRLPEFDLALPFSPTDFTQVNHRVNETLVSRVVRLLAPEPSDVVADFFCGLGNFTLPVATLARRVVGIEGSVSLVERARFAAESNGLSDRTQFEARNLFDFTLDDWYALSARHGVVSRVLIDPPREGALALAQVLAAASGHGKATRVVYVSCNVATLARDCGLMVSQGGWTLRAAGVVNMFPHTSHVESIAWLERAD